MKKLKRLFARTAQGVVDWATGGGLGQEENIPQGQRYITPGMPELLRRCGSEGIVLLKNEDQLLPLEGERTVAVFGRCQYDTFYCGYGSGGDVHPPYSVCLMDGLKNGGIRVYEPLAQAYQNWRMEDDNRAEHGWWGHWPYFHPEMPLAADLVEAAAREADTALVILGRAAGEDRENVLRPGSFYLTDLEKAMLDGVCKAFKKVVLLLNCGSVIDLSFLESYPFGAVLYVWQLGQEMGNAVADVLTGKADPGGRLTDSIARRYGDYPSSDSFGNRDYNEYREDIFVGYRYFETLAPEKVLYPFGYGLSYTEFSLSCVSFAREQGRIAVSVEVRNTGHRSGREVVQLYGCPPRGKLTKPRKVLVAFGKTGILAPGESQTLTMAAGDADLASFDEDQDAFILEPGEYTLMVGRSAREGETVGSFHISQTQILCQCMDACGPKTAFSVRSEQGSRTVSVGKADLHRRILDALPEEIPYTGDRGIQLKDVAAGTHSLEEFIAQLTDKDLADLSKGEGSMSSPQGTLGNAGAFGGVTPRLRDLGVPPLITADGPSGIRLKKYTSLLPIGTAIACTWDTTLVEEVFNLVGREARRFGVDVLLAPGMNIHRDPLCGRNFEYYSEDPLLCGKIAAAAVRGLQNGGTSACPKHFACNNQETNRNRNDSRVSKRALREIYLKCFEICIKESKPQNLMTSYNKINGVWSHYNYDLVTTVLRKEWGYEGNILTDWWMQRAESPEFPNLRDNAYRVRAQVDVLMPGNMSRVFKGYRYDPKQLKTLGKPEGLTRGELQRTAKNVLRFALLRLAAKETRNG